MKEFLRNFIVYNMFMPMNRKKNWANRGTTEQTKNANERTNGSPSEQAASRMTELMVKRSNERSTAKTNE